MKIIYYFLILATMLLLPSASFRSPDSKVYQFDYENVMGTSFQLKLRSYSVRAAVKAEQIALTEIDRLTAILSTYDQSSEISRWQKNSDKESKISSELFEVLQLFDSWKERTSGALTASIASSTTLWNQAELRQQIPNEAELTTAIEAMTKPQWLLNQSTQTAIHLSDQPLVLHSFVKSYIIRKVADQVMNVQDIEGAVINIGGDIVVTGNSDEMIKITDPNIPADNASPIVTISLHDRAVATSGNYRRGFQIGDAWFSHIIDPRTAYPCAHILSATVVAPNATDAGALATAFNILQPEESKALAATLPDVEFQIITADGRCIVSEGWNKLVIPAGERVNENATNNPVQNKLTIELELARFEGRFRRPFVAVWVENKNKESIKTIALWYNKPRWLPDLKRWYSKNQPMLDDMISIGSISSATRSAGKYTLVWDGVGDNGKAVPAGTYTIYIEAAREHGTYQLMKQEIDWNGKPKHIDLKGGTEITAASIEISK